MKLSAEASKVLNWIKENPIDIAEWFRDGKPAWGSIHSWNEIQLNETLLVKKSVWRELNDIVVPSNSKEFLFEIKQ